MQLGGGHTYTDDVAPTLQNLVMHSQSTLVIWAMWHKHTGNCVPLRVRMQPWFVHALPLLMQDAHAAIKLCARFTLSFAASTIFKALLSPIPREMMYLRLSICSLLCLVCVNAFFRVYDYLLVCTLVSTCQL